MEFFRSEMQEWEKKLEPLFYPWLIAMGIFVLWNGIMALKSAIFYFMPWQQVGYCFLFFLGIFFLFVGEKKGMYLIGEGFVLYLLCQVFEIVDRCLNFRGDKQQFLLSQIGSKTLDLELIVFAVQLTVLACHSMWPDFNDRVKQEHWTCRDVVKRETTSFIGLSLFLMGALFVPLGYVVCFLQFYVGILMLPDDVISIPLYILGMGLICGGLAMLILRWFQNSRLLRWLTSKKRAGIAIFFSIIMCIRILVATLDLNSVHLSDEEIIGNAIIESLNPMNEIDRLVYVIPITLLIFYAKRIKKEEEKWNWFDAVICWGVLFVTWFSGLKLAAGIPLLIKHLF